MLDFRDLSQQFVVYNPTNEQKLSAHSYVFYSLGLRLIPKVDSSSNPEEHHAQEDEKFICLVPGCPLNQDLIPIDHTHSHFTFFHSALFHRACTKFMNEFGETTSNEKQKIIQFYQETYALRQIITKYLEILTDELESTELLLQSEGFAPEIIAFAREQADSKKWDTNLLHSPILANLIMKVQKKRIRTPTPNRNVTRSNRDQTTGKKRKPS